jgi:hypothetical protein
MTSNVNDFAMIRPVAITPALLTSSSVPEPATGANPDPAEWSNATPYNNGDRASRASIHKIYQRVGGAGGLTSIAPESDPLNWVLVGGTNRWKMFDGSVEAQTTNNDSIVVVITPGVLADQLALINIDADTARVQVAGTGYDQTINLRTRYTNSWFEYFFEPFVYRTDAVFSGLPLLTGNVITLTLTKTGSVVKCGEMVLGLARALGGVQYGAGAGIIDYSVKQTDQFGSTTVVRRPFSKRMNVDLLIDAGRVDEIQKLLADYRASPVVWVGSGNLYAVLIVYGYYRRFEIVINYPTHSKCTLELEGLT